MTRIFIVIPVFNRLEYTKECLASLFTQRGVDIEVIVVDSGSTDSTVSYIRKRYPQAVLIKGNNTWWWTRATNEGIVWASSRAKTGDFVLLLNNDCYFGPNYLKDMLSIAKTNPRAIVGSLCLDIDNPTKVVEGGIRLDWKSGLVIPLTSVNGDSIGEYSKKRIIDKIDALPGKGTLIPIKVFKQIGTFEVKRLPHYLADYEFTFRAKQHNYKLLIYSKLVVWHHRAATGSSFDSFRNYSLKEGFSLLFGRKSMNNIFDWINFILLACPAKYRLRNFGFLLARLVAALTRINPFHFFIPRLPWPEVLAGVGYKKQLEDNKK